MSKIFFVLSLFYVISAPLIAAPGQPQSRVKTSFDTVIAELKKYATGKRDYFLNLGQGNAFGNDEFLFSRFINLFDQKTTQILDDLDINPDPQNAEYKELEALKAAQKSEWFLFRNSNTIFPILPTDFAGKTPEQIWAEFIHNYRYYAMGERDQLVNFGNSSGVNSDNFARGPILTELLRYLGQLKENFQGEDDKNKLTEAYLDTVRQWGKIVENPTRRVSDSQEPYAAVRPFGYDMHIRLFGIENREFKYLDTPYGSFMELLLGGDKVGEALKLDLPVQVRSRSVPIAFKTDDVTNKLKVTVEEWTHDNPNQATNIKLVKETLEGYLPRDNLIISTGSEQKFSYYAEAGKNYRLVFTKPDGQAVPAGMRVTNFVLGK